MPVDDLRGIKKITFENGIEEIEYSIADVGDRLPEDEFSEVVLGNTIETIQGYFLSGSKIKTISFPTSLQNLSDGFLQGCNYLETIIMNPINPPLGEYTNDWSSALSGVSTDYKIYVPDQSVEAYKAVFTGSDYQDGTVADHVYPMSEMK